MTKFAMEAYADALADEMKSFGVNVSLIEPGAYRSNIGKSALERMADRNQSADDSKFKEAMDDSVNWLSRFENDQGDPMEVAASVMNALFDDDPGRINRLESEFGGVTIGQVVGIDAAGTRVPGMMNFDGDHLELVLDDAFVSSASYPLVLDPVEPSTVARSTRSSPVAGFPSGVLSRSARVEAGCSSTSSVATPVSDTRTSWPTSERYPSSTKATP